MGAKSGVCGCAVGVRVAVGRLGGVRRHVAPGAPAGPGVGEQSALAFLGPRSLLQAGASAVPRTETAGASAGRERDSSEPGACGLPLGLLRTRKSDLLAWVMGHLLER